MCALGLCTAALEELIAEPRANHLARGDCPWPLDSSAASIAAPSDARHRPDGGRHALPLSEEPWPRFLMATIQHLPGHAARWQLLGTYASPSQACCSCLAHEKPWRVGSEVVFVLDFFAHVFEKIG